MNENHQTAKPLIISAIRKDIALIEATERKEILDETLKQIENETEENLLGLFKSVHKQVASKEDKKLILDTWKNKALTLSQKVHFLANYIADTYSLPFVQNALKFLEILNTDTELNLFAANPQGYIDSHKNLSAYERHILQIIINDPVFNHLPSVNLPATQGVSTPLAEQMHQLNLPQYASTDAARFRECIHPDLEDEVLAKSKKEYYGPQVMGLAGAMANYHREAIKQTALNVKKMKMGACHTFAQLAADHFLSLIEKNQLNPMPIKMVSHQNDLGSHTFLLIDHTSNDLTDLSHCLIVDPWAVAMGHRATNGVYTKDNYPFPAMTSKLVCCYDNQAAVIADEKSEKATSASFDQELQRAVLSRGFFSERSVNQRQEGLSASQITSVNFLTELASITGHATKKSLMQELIDAVKSKHLSPTKAVILATVASQARFIEKQGDHYKWKKPTTIDQSTLAAFNNESMQLFWKNFIEKKGIATIDKDFKTIDANTLHKIVNFLNQHEEVLAFNQSASVRPRI